MKLIVGLGNYGKEYENTRHNMGFLFLDYYLKDLNPVYKEKFQGLYFKTKINDEDIIFLKPQTYMNLSGTSVVQFVNYFKIDLIDVLVVFDDMDLAPGRFRLRASGSSGGHKGIANIIDQLKTENIQRIKIGVGNKGTEDVVNYVLGVPCKEDRKSIEEAMVEAGKAVDCYLKYGFEKASTTFNKKAK